jgi:hypothetical protein
VSDPVIEERIRRLERAVGLRPPTNGVGRDHWDSAGHYWGDWEDWLTGETAENLLGPRAVRQARETHATRRQVT